MSVNYELKLHPDADALARQVASDWLDVVQQAHSEERPFSVALSGGRITKTLFQRTVELARARSCPFNHVHFFWADERCLPPTDPESNFALAEELLFGPLGISAAQVHRILGEADPTDAAKQAEAELSRVLAGQSAPALDLVFLGLGEDGHIASLFPGESEEAAANPALFRAIFNSPKPPPRRVTLGYGPLATARQVWMLASGKGKEAALQESLSANGKTPFARLLRLRSQTRIHTDLPRPAGLSPG